MLALTIATLIELLIMITIDDMVYANVIEWTIYIILLPLGFVYGIVGLMRGVTSGTLVRNGILMVVPAILFVLALPHFTYDQGKVLISKQSKNQVNQFTIATSRTVPVTQGYAWLLYHREYYYQATLRNSGKRVFYMVNPVSGKVLSRSEDYWGSH